MGEVTIGFSTAAYSLRYAVCTTHSSWTYHTQIIDARCFNSVGENRNNNITAYRLFCNFKKRNSPIGQSLLETA